MRSTCRSKEVRRLPALRLRVMHGQVTCLVRFPVWASRQRQTGALALIACPRAPFLLRLRLYHRRQILPSGDAPRAA